MAQAPKISGNSINGLGEAEPRRPSVVYWAKDTSEIAHGRMQEWFYTVDPGDPRFGEARKERLRMAATPLPDQAACRVEESDETWVAGLQSFVDQGLCEKVGVAEIDPSWVFEHESVGEPRIVMVAVQHDYGEISSAPKPTAGAEVMRQYNRAVFAAREIAGWIRQKGWSATPVEGPMTGAVTLIPPALAAGFGELGKHGSIINPEFGASFRLAGILTDAPLPISSQEEHGIDDFCSACRICEDACPPEAIFPDKKTVRGVEKWYVDFDKCLPFFNQTQGCAICIAVCPWSRPGVGLNLAEKLARREARKER